MSIQTPPICVFCARIIEKWCYIYLSHRCWGCKLRSTWLQGPHDCRASTLNTEPSYPFLQCIYKCFLYVSICVFTLKCASLYMCVWLDLYTCAHGSEDQWTSLAVVHQVAPMLFFSNRAFCRDPKLADLLRPSGQWSPGIFLSLLFLHWDDKHMPECPLLFCFVLLFLHCARY